MDGGCWLSGWTCNERATMLYALYVLYVRMCVRGCACGSMCQMLRDAMLCSGRALPSLLSVSALLCGVKGKQRDAVSMRSSR